MAAAPLQFGDSLAAWVDRLDEAGYHVGVRERLLVHSLLARMAADGELPQSTTLEQTLRIVRPILCIQPEQQRRYETLLREFVDERRPAKRGALRAAGGSSSDDRRIGTRRVLWLVLAAAVVALAVFGTLRFWPHKISEARQQTPPGTEQPGPPPSSPPTTNVLPVYVPVGSLAIANNAQPVTPQWAAPVRTALLAVGAVSAIGLLWLGIGRWRRQLYLRGTRTDEEVKEKLLADPDPISVEPPPPLARRAARSLRQRYAGETLALDIKATLRATVKASGGFSPRYSLVKQTPEYLILIDRRHAFDHHAVYCEALVAALVRNGVNVQVFYFEGSPQAGCWRAQAAQQPTRRYAAMSFSEMARRHAGHRLVVFAEARALADEATGAPRAWANHLNAFPQRAWLTPMPLASWGLAEQIADSQGFLVLPVQHEALRTLGDWFSSDRLGLEVAPDWPLSFPPLLQPNAVVWVTFVDSPPQKVVDELVFQLRAYLGAMRFQWLSACAIFPAISPSVTLALGRELTRDARELALGFAAIGALPWFRHGFMPAWLRSKLIEQLEPQLEARFRAIIEERLATAIEGPGMGLAAVAQRKNRLFAWLRRGRGPARDVVLVDFISRSGMTRLVQRLPDALRRRLFRDGVPTYGLRSGVVAILPVAVLIAGAAASGLWNQVLVPKASAPLQAIATLSTDQGVLEALAFSPDGRRITSAGQVSWGMWDVRSRARALGHDGRAFGVAFSPDGLTIASGGQDATLRLWDAKTGAQIGEPLSGYDSPVTSVAFSSDGSLLASGSQRGSIVVWNANRRLMRQSAPSGNAVGNIAFSTDGSVLAFNSGRTVLFWDMEQQTEPRQSALDTTVSSLAFNPVRAQLAVTTLNGLWLLDAGRGQQLGSAPVASGSFRSVAFSPDGKQIATGETDGAVRLWDVASGKTVGAPLLGHAGAVQSVAFSPDGRRIASAGADGTVRLWGSPIEAVADVIGCNVPTSVNARQLADRIAAAWTQRVPGLAPAAYDNKTVAWDLPPDAQENEYVAQVFFRSTDENDIATNLAAVVREAVSGNNITVETRLAQATRGWDLEAQRYIVQLPCRSERVTQEQSKVPSRDAEVSKTSTGRTPLAPPSISVSEPAKTRPGPPSAAREISELVTRKQTSKADDSVVQQAQTSKADDSVVQQAQTSPPEAQTYESPQEAVKQAPTRDERTPTLQTDNSIRDVSPVVLAMEPQPDDQVNAVWVTFSDAGSPYTAVHVFRQGDPYILLSSTNKDEKHLLSVAEILASEFKGRFEASITDRGDDISQVISVPGGFSQRALAMQVQGFYSKRFSRVSIPAVYYLDRRPVSKK